MTLREEPGYRLGSTSMCSSKFTMYTAFVLPDVGGGGGIRQQPQRDNPGFHVQLQELEKSPQGEEEAR